MMNTRFGVVTGVKRSFTVVQIVAILKGSPFQGKD